MRDDRPIIVLVAAILITCLIMALAIYFTATPR